MHDHAQYTIIKSERTDLEVDDMLFVSQGPLAEVDNKVSVKFGAFIAMHQESHDDQVHSNFAITWWSIYERKKETLLDVVS
jgi:hypothetical protein